jgi:uridine kinase
MRGDKLIIEDYHRKAAQLIVKAIIEEVDALSRRYVLTVAGESGSGKSETGQAIKKALVDKGVKAVVLAQDDYFMLPPKSNARRRREDPAWLGPHIEINLDNLEQNLIDAIKGETRIQKPLVDYNKNSILDEWIDLIGVKAIIAEGTYTSLLRNVDKRIFIDRDYQETLEHRQQRNRGNEANDPFVEGLLATEHKIIAGHKHLANIIITNEYDVTFTQQVI